MNTHPFTSIRTNLRHLRLLFASPCLRVSVVNHPGAMLIALLLAFAAPAHGQQLTETWRVADGLRKPESVVHDAERDLLYISNINGSGAAKDGNGYITRVAMTGEVLDAKWIDGLNAPKGLAIAGDKLYAADIDTLVEIDLTTGAIAARHDAPGAQFLNDVAVDADGNVYVSDSARTTIYRLRNGRVDTWVEHPDLARPNGLYVEDDRLIVLASDRTAADPGKSRYLHTVSLATQKVAPLARRAPIGGLDTVEADHRGGYFLTEWFEGQLLHVIPPDDPQLLADLPGAADVEYRPDAQLLYVPAMLDHAVIAYRVTWPE